MANPNTVPPARERLRRQLVFRSPVVAIGVFRAPAGSDLFGWQLPPEHFAIAFPETSVRIRPRRGPEFVTDRNLVTLYEPDDVYARSLVDPHGDRCTFFSPSPEVAREFADNAGLAVGDRRVFRRAFEGCPPAVFRRHRRLMSSLLGEAEASRAWVEEEALGVLAGIAAAASGRVDAETLSPSARRAADRARDFLAVSYAEAPALEAIAANAGCSPYHLSRVFRTRFGTTLHGYRTELALRDGYDRIIATDTRLLDIALELGFASHSHFGAAFSRAFGVVPSSLRGDGAMARA